MTAPHSPPRRRRLSAPERRAKILDSAREVFLSAGFVGARTRVIAEKAEINEAVLYKHFASKDELFREAVLLPLREEMQQMADRIVALIDGRPGDATSDDLALWIERELIRSMGEIFPLLGIALFAGREIGQEFYLEYLYRELGAALSAITQRAGIPERAAGRGRLVALIMGAAMGHALDAHFREVRLGYTRIARQVSAMLMHGLSNPPPPQAR
jgi:TetR/AcrR family transcriptional regulator